MILESLESDRFPVKTAFGRHEYPLHSMLIYNEDLFLRQFPAPALPRDGGCLSGEKVPIAEFLKKSDFLFSPQQYLFQKCFNSRTTECSGAGRWTRAERTNGYRKQKTKSCMRGGSPRAALPSRSRPDLRNPMQSRYGPPILCFKKALKSLKKVLTSLRISCIMLQQIFRSANRSIPIIPERFQP